MTFTATATRSCSRCRKELSDPASVQCGVGPDCRGKNNKLFSLTIPANFPMVYSMLSQAVTVAGYSGLPEAPMEVLQQTLEKFHTRATRAHETQESPTNEVIWSGMDLREVIRNIDWLLSWSMNEDLRKLLIGTVDYAGYPALANVFKGDASMGECSFGFDQAQGKIWFLPKRNRHGAYALATQAQAAWCAGRWIIPTQKLAEFETVVRTFYPMFTSSFEELRATVQQYLETHQEQEISSLPVAEVTQSNGRYLVKTPWLQDQMYQYLEAMKAEVPRNHRTYSGGTWTISAAFFPRWRRVAEQYYTIQVSL